MTKLENSGLVLSTRAETFRTLFGLQTVSLTIALITWWTHESFFNIDIPASFSWFGNDGWCFVPNESIGVHCFGDFNERVAQRSEDFKFPAWHNNLELTPIGPLITSLGNFFSLFLNPRIALLIFVFVYGFAMLIPIIDSTKNLEISEKLLAYSSFTVGTVPFIATLDRLNNVALTVPLLYLFYLGIVQENSKYKLIAVTFLVIIKPQFIILVLIFFQRRQLKLAAQSIVLTVSSIFIMVVAPGGWKFSRFIEWVDTSLSYGYDFRIADLEHPINISFNRSVYLLGKLISQIPEFYSVNWIAEEIMHNSNNISMIISGLILLFVILFGNKLDSLYSAFLVTLVACIGFGQYVAVYYSIFVIPILAILLKSSFVHKVKNDLSESKLKRDGSFLLYIATILSTTLVPISVGTNLVQVPGSTLQNGDLKESLVLEIINFNLATIFWLAFIFSKMLKKNSKLIRFNSIRRRQGVHRIRR